MVVLLSDTNGDSMTITKDFEEEYGKLVEIDFDSFSILFYEDGIVSASNVANFYDKEWR